MEKRRFRFLHFLVYLYNVVKDVVEDEKAASCHKEEKKAYAGGEKFRVCGRKLQRALLAY